MAILRFPMAMLPLAALWAQTPTPDPRAPAFRQLLDATPKIPTTPTQLTLDTLGIVSSIASDKDGLMYILQRGEKADPVIVFDREGKVRRSWGKGMYNQPHSIRIDPDGNVWTVDAGNSMLLKFTPEGKKLQEISVGEVATGKNCFTPVLCGTTDVAFGPNGRLFISDGYGNARVLEYSKDGKRVNQWGTSGTGPGQFQVPHGIAVGNNTVYVADRTNARIQRFDLSGKYLGEWTHLGRPFALDFENGTLWSAGVTLDQPAKPYMLKIDAKTGKLEAQGETSGPHAIDFRGGSLYTTGCCGGSAPTTFTWFK